MSVANSYARALYETAATESAGQPQALDLIETQMDEMVQLLEQHKEARVALVGPVTTAREKVALVTALSKKSEFVSVLERFLVLLARKGRLRLLQKIREAFTHVRLAAEGGVAGRLVSAETMSEADVEILAKAFSKKLGKRVAFRVSTDASLLAGMKVTVNGITYDGTLRSQLQKLRDRFATGFSGNA